MMQFARIGTLNECNISQISNEKGFPTPWIMTISKKKTNQSRRIEKTCFFGRQIASTIDSNHHIGRPIPKFTWNDWRKNILHHWRSITAKLFKIMNSISESFYKQWSTIENILQLQITKVVRKPNHTASLHRKLEKNASKSEYIFQSINRHLDLVLSAYIYSTIAYQYFTAQLGSQQKICWKMTKIWVSFLTFIMGCEIR